MQNFRSMGPRGLDAYVRQYGNAASAQLDAVCAQKDAHTALLYWFTDLDLAIAEAQRTQRPILSLRLLGRLDDELSCANSRFFRKSLYVDRAINRALRERFVLHWQSVRPVPKVTIDFGGGKTLVKTLTGNSTHLVLDMYGRPVDALPGLFSAEVFAQLLARAHAMAMTERKHLPALHRRELERPVVARRAPQPRAFDASRLAMTKHVVEFPVLRNVTMDVDADTLQNLELHAQVHQVFAAGMSWTIEQLVDWMYRELFLMPPDDPALGLDVPDPFTTLQS
jgi:hypothetical protein